MIIVKFVLFTFVQMSLRKWAPYFFGSLKTENIAFLDIFSSFVSLILKYDP